jgi:competence ComEA-like helix-hairpin-helix protein
METAPVWKRARTAVALLACAPFATVAISLGAHAATAQDPGDRPANAFTRVCSSCHDADRILATRRTRTQWEEIIEKMIERGAEGTEDDFAATEQYLLRVSGRVNVNRALAKDLVAVLGLADKDADAILEYRKAQGDFKDFDELCKVPGIDLEKLKHERDAVSF